MTHIDTYSHRIPHKLTQLHTNTHILHTFTHKLPHLWVGHKKSHVYIYIYIYIQQNHTFYIQRSSHRHDPEQLKPPTIEKKIPDEPDQKLKPWNLKKTSTDISF